MAIATAQTPPHPLANAWQRTMAPGGLGWFAAHDLRLAWRDWVAMVTAGRTTRGNAALAVVALGIIGLHALAYAVLKKPLAAGITANVPTLLLISGASLLAFSLMLSQALESITRVLYTRSDLDLILSAPTSHASLFAVRIMAIVGTTALLSGGLTAPFLNVAAVIDGPHWLAGYLAIIALAAIATALATLITFALFATIGPRRTRLVAQIVAAVIGATFLIGTQVAAIVWYGQMSRMAVFVSPETLAAAPGVANWLYVPARAVMGEALPVLVVIVLAGAALTGAIIWAAKRLATATQAAASVGHSETDARAATPLAAATPAQALRAKELRLLTRDPWLVSQTLMQVLYLIPPAVMLWQSFGAGVGAAVIVVPVFVMAVGQLAGGLAWLAISGEDAADLVATAPLPARAVTLAKIQSVMMVIAALAVPLALLISPLSVIAGAAAIVGMLAASLSAVAIQLMFKMPLTRAHFRRRQTASRVATFSEAFSSILWAATAGFAAAGSLITLPSALLATAVLGVAWLLRPSE